MIVARATEAAGSTIMAGQFVSWRASTGEARGLVLSVHTSGLVPGIAHAHEATAAQPAARVQLFAQNGQSWEATTAHLGIPVAALTAVDPLPLPANGREAMVTGSFDQIRSVVRQAIVDRIKEMSGVDYVYVWIYDLGTTWAVYCVGNASDDMWLVNYAIADDEVTVTLGVDAMKVRPVTMYQPVAGDAVVESVRDDHGARVIEAKGVGADGSRIFRVEIIRYGDSRNMRRYPADVLRAAASLYEGSKAFDHHRTEAEMATSTIVGMVGTYRNVIATATGIEADLFLLPGATHAAESLDMALANAALGQPALVGISHDVMARWTPISVGGRPMMEAVEILSVNSNDLVAHPAAGGQVTRMVAASDPNASPTNRTGENEVTLKQLMALLRAAESSEARTALLTTHAAVLEANGLTPEEANRASEAAPAPVAGATGSTVVVPVVGTVVTAPVAEAGTQLTKASMLGKLVIKTAVEGANLGAHMVEAITAELPEAFTEAEVNARVATAGRMLAGIEAANLAPTVPAADVRVVAESLEKKIKALDGMFAGTEGFRSIKQAFMEIAPELTTRPRHIDPFASDFAQQIIRESSTMVVDGHRQQYDSGRSVESLTTTSWGEILGDSITRRMIAEYGLAALQSWRPLVKTYPVSDFRTQRIDRLGGYGLLPTVNQGAPYQPLTSPTDEEVTYAVTKKGGTEDLTLEMIRNDDLRAIVQIPTKLARAAALTLYRFVWEFFNANAAIYDTVALFHAGHSNTDATALSGAAMSVGRKKMRKQAAYGVTEDVMSLAPKFLIVCSDLEELAWEICTSTVAMPSGAPVGAASNIPNIHQGVTPIVVDYWTSTTQWFLAADPAMVPTIEVGFLDGAEEPALFVQNDPNSGSQFAADKTTFKIRHIYGGAVLDFRGLYRGNS